MRSSLSLNIGCCHLLWSSPTSRFLFPSNYTSALRFTLVHVPPGSHFIRPQVAAAGRQTKQFRWCDSGVKRLPLGHFDSSCWGRGECYSLAFSTRVSSTCQHKILQTGRWNWACGTIWTSAEAVQTDSIETLCIWIINNVDLSHAVCQLL